MRRFSLFIATLFLCWPSVASAQANLPPTLWHLLVLAHSDPAKTLTDVNAYIVAHPNDGNGFAVRCATRTIMVELHAQLPLDMNAAEMSAVVADCRRAIDLAPRSAYAHYIYGDLFYDSNRLTDALAQYSTAVDLGQTTDDVFGKRCDTYRRLNELDDALTDCNRQVALTPVAAVYYSRGVLQDWRNDYTDAISDLTKALSGSEQPFTTDAFYWRGVAYAALGKDALAEDDLTAAIDRGDTSPDTFYLRGQVRIGLGRVQDGVADLDVAAQRYRALGMNHRATQAQSLAEVTNPAAPVALASPAPTIVMLGTSFDSSDVSALEHGITAAFSPTDHSIHLAIIVKDSSDMPAYDTAWHYAGSMTPPGSAPTVTVWIASNVPAQLQRQAIVTALILGLCDSGYAGPKWKQLYEVAAGEDAALGATAPDPFVNRRKLATQLYAKIIRSS